MRISCVFLCRFYGIYVITIRCSENRGQYIKKENGNLQSLIEVEDLHKIYRIPVREQGLTASLKSLLKPVYNDVIAVDRINFSVERGETVGFIGPNGAGKTTTLKMLSGLLYPTSGYINVSDYTPSDRKADYLKKISMIMGNKSQIIWDITVSDSLNIVKDIYQVSDKNYAERLNDLIDLLEIDELLPKLTRNLSLGERAKCEFAAALIYGPDILYLDEPTLGMDVSIQYKIRNFIKEYRLRNNTTIILTSHYMADITSLCERVILINRGKLIYDGELQVLADRLMPFKLIRITLNENSHANHDNIQDIFGTDVLIIDRDEQNYTIRVKKDDVANVALSIIKEFSLKDFTIEDPPVEDVIDQIYREGLGE